MTRVVAIIQARLTSTRFPGKVLEPISGHHTVISSMVERMARCESSAQVVFAIPDNLENCELAKHLKDLGCDFYSGSEHDVRSRFVNVARQTKADLVVRLTGDCPLVDPDLVDSVVDLAFQSGVEYASNIKPRTFPKGLDVEVFTTEALERSFVNYNSELDVEHVTWSMRESGDFSTSNFSNPLDFSQLRWVIDLPEDIHKLRPQLPEHFVEMGWKQLVEFGVSGIS